MTTNLYQASLELSRSARPAVEAVVRRDAALGRRLKRACERAAEHVEDGMCALGRSRLRDYRLAAGAAREAMACVRAAESSGYLPEGDRGLKEQLSAFALRVERRDLAKAKAA